MKLEHFFTHINFEHPQLYEKMINYVYYCDILMTNQTEYPRRFVAGATCAKCRQTDSTVIFSVNMQYHTECIKCGFTQSQEDLQSTVAGKQPLRAIDNSPDGRQKTLIFEHQIEAQNIKTFRRR